MSRGKRWVTEPDQEIEVQVAERGFGSLKPITVIEALKATVANHGTCNAMASQTKIDVSLIVLQFSIAVLTIVSSN
jgi:hypothetical protein